MAATDNYVMLQTSVKDALRALSNGDEIVEFAEEIGILEVIDGCRVFVLPKIGDVVRKLQVCSAQHIGSVRVRYQGRVLWQSNDDSHNVVEIPMKINLMAAGDHDIRIEVQGDISVKLLGIFRLYSDMDVRKIIATTTPVMADDYRI